MLELYSMMKIKIISEERLIMYSLLKFLITDMLELYSQMLMIHLYRLMR